MLCVRVFRFRKTGDIGLAMSHTDRETRLRRVVCLGRIHVSDHQL